VSCSVLQWVAVCCSGLQCVAVCCSVLQCDAMFCSVLQKDAVCCTTTVSCDARSSNVTSIYTSFSTSTFTSFSNMYLIFDPQSAMCIYSYILLFICIFMYEYIATLHQSRKALTSSRLVLCPSHVDPRDTALSCSVAPTPPAPFSINFSVPPCPSSLPSSLLYCFFSRSRSLSFALSFALALSPSHSRHLPLSLSCSCARSLAFSFGFSRSRFVILSVALSLSHARSVCRSPHQANLKIKAVRDENTRELDSSNSALWAAVGALKKSLGVYFDFVYFYIVLCVGVALWSYHVVFLCCVVY